MGTEHPFAVSYVLENRERERLEPTVQESRGRMGMLVCGCGFVCAHSGGRLVGARDELLHRGLLPYRAASPSEKTDCAAFRHPLRACHGRIDGLFHVVR